MDRSPDVVRKREPRNVDFPAELGCDFCPSVVKRHCKHCAWYPCRACNVVAVITGYAPNPEGGVTWITTHRPIDPHFFYYWK